VGDYFSAKQLALETANIITAANNQPGWFLSGINDFQGHSAIVRLFRQTLENWKEQRPAI